MRMFTSLLAIATAFAAHTTLAHAQSGGADIEEIVVTAQKREESLQDVPVSVTALTAAQLDKAGISGTRELMYVTPGLVFTQGSFVARPQVRSVGTRAVGPGDEATVPVYIDGVYQSMQDTAFFDFNSVERVEVLKGPQGTLFGRNAVGGAISVITTDPGPAFQAKAAASYDSSTERKGDVYLNAPIAEGLAANLALHANADSGYIKDDANLGNEGQSSSFAARGKLRWDATENTYAILGASYLNTKDKSAISNHPIDGYTSVRAANPNVPIADGYHSNLSERVFLAMHNRSVWAKVNSTFDGFDLDILGAYQKTDLHTNGDGDGTNVSSSNTSYRKTDESWQGEVRAASNGEGPLKWIGGVFLFSAKAGYGLGDQSDWYRSRSSPTGQVLALQAQSDVKSYAVFGELTYDFTDRLSVTGGLRYSDEKRDFSQSVSRTAFGRPLLPLAPNGPDVSSSFNKISPRVSVGYEFAENVRGYATYSEGFKSGLYNASSTNLPLTALRPEVLKSVEVGLKTEPMPNMRLNVGAYHYNYTDLQVSTRGLLGVEVQNAASAKIYGAEAELQWNVTSQLRVNGALSWNHSRFDEFPAAQVFTPRADRAGYTAAFADASGNSLPKAPDWTFNLSAAYDIPLANSDVTISGSYYLSSHYYSDLGNSVRESGYDNLNAQISWAPRDGNYRVAVFGENLTDTRRLLTNTISAAGQTGVLAKPLLVGARFEIEFN